MGDFQILQRLYVGSIVHMGWAILMIIAVSGYKNNVNAVQPTGFDSGFTVWCHSILVLQILDDIRIVQSGTANNTDLHKDLLSKAYPI
jgi:hypothetical protein